MASKKSPPACPESERDLFLRYVGGDVRSKKEKAQLALEPKPEVKKTARNKPEAEDDLLFLRSLDESFNSPDFAQKRNSSSQPKDAKPRAAPRPIGPEAAIDLHACTLEIALRRTEEFLVRCLLKKFRKVLIIHGKGSGILKEGVRKYLSHHAGVLHIEDAEKQHGGSGAAMVFLRR